MRNRLYVVGWLCVVSVCGTVVVSQEPRAFPGAVGFGAYARGGRGGEVYHVTTLRDTGSEGSLRVGIEESDRPRTIVFDVGGEIELGHLMRIKRDNLTIAGQTAPAGGITLSGYPLAIEGASDVVVRFLRLRTGDSNVKGRGGDLENNLADALSIFDSERIVIDHVSASWSLDETLSLTDSRDVTIQHCIFSESLHDSYHPDGPHGMGGLLRGKVSSQNRRDGVGGYTLYGNLFAHHNARNPGVGGERRGDRRGLDVDFVNNVIYNWGSLSGHTLTDTGIRMNYVGNYLIAGPDTAGDKRDVAFEEHHPGDFSIYHKGNRVDADRDSKHDGRALDDGGFRTFSKDELVSGRFSFPRVEALDADDAYQRVLEAAGASRPRDSVDRRVVKDVRKREGEIIDSQRQVGGFDVEEGASPRDRDADGMPDAFEEKFGLNPERDRDADDFDLSDSGYTNLEVYLHSLVTDVFPDEVTLGGPGPFLRGDCDGDGSACGTVNDAVFLLSWLFVEGRAPTCFAACDADLTAELDLSDAVFLLSACLLGEGVLPAPFPECGHSPRPTDRELGCDVSPGECEDALAE